MVDVVSPEKRSEMMAGIRATNTKPEILVRKILHRSGFRFSLQRKDLPGKPYIVLPKWNVVIFVHGCFWHGHENCPIFRLPRSRAEFWSEKIETNRARDSHARLRYLDTHWRVIEIWECAAKGRSKLATDALAARLANAIKLGTEKVFSIRGYTL